MDINTIINNKYQITHLIGKGGYGEVYGANDLLLKRSVAVKILKIDTAKAKVASERFLKEAQLTSQLTHPHTLTIFDFGQYNGQLFIVSELLQGESLRSRLHRVGRFSPLQLAKLFLPICSALQEAHQIGVVHRDLKPDNLFLHKVFDEERLILIDFGIAKSLGSIQLTQSGQVFGTPHYMAPEQIKEAKGVDSRADIYSLGVIFFEALSGKLPFNGRSMFEIFEAHVRSPIPKLATLLSQEFKVWDKLLSKMLAKAPSQRLSSAKEVSQALKEIQKALIHERTRSQAPNLQRISFSMPRSLPLVPDDLNELIAPNHHGLHQTTEVLSEVKPSSISEGGVVANSDQNIAQHSIQPSVVHQDRNSLSQDNSGSPGLKPTQAILNTRMNTFPHSKKTTADFNPTINLNKIHFTLRTLKLISYFLFISSLFWLGVKLLEKDHFDSHTQMPVQAPLSSSDQVITELIDLKKNDEPNKLKEQLNKKVKATHIVIDSETNRTNTDALSLGSLSILDPASRAKPNLKQTTNIHHSSEYSHSTKRVIHIDSSESAVEKKDLAHSNSKDKASPATQVLIGRSRSKQNRSNSHKSKRNISTNSTKKASYTQSKARSSKPKSIGQSSRKSKMKRTKSKKGRPTEHLKGAKVHKRHQTIIRFEIFLEPTGPIKRGQTVKVKLRLKQGKARVRDLKVHLETKQLAKFNRSLKTSTPFKVSKPRTIGSIKTIRNGQVRLKVCLKSFCKTLVFKTIR